jgi:hypothetical protein
LQLRNACSDLSEGSQRSQFAKLFEKQKKAYCMICCKPLIFKLPDQGSNLDSSDSESDVLPITPSGIFFDRAKIKQNFVGASVIVIFLEIEWLRTIFTAYQLFD